MKRFIWLIPVILLIAGGIALASHKTASQPPIKPQPLPPLSATHVLGLVNDERVKAGLSALQTSLELMKTAQAKCEDMVNNHYFAHESPSGKSPDDYIRPYYPYGHAGENLARNYLSDESTVDGWMHSTEHRENILSPDYKYTGLAICYESDIWHIPLAVQHFAS